MKKTFTTALTGEEMQSPFGGYATTFPPQAWALQGSAKPCTHKSLYFKHGLFCSLHREKSGAARIGGGERSEPVSRMVSAIYAAERHSRNADYILIARKGNPSPLNPLNPHIICLEGED